MDPVGVPISLSLYFQERGHAPEAMQEGWILAAGTSNLFFGDSLYASDAVRQAGPARLDPATSRDGGLHRIHRFRETNMITPRHPSARLPADSTRECSTTTPFALDQGRSG